MRPTNNQQLSQADGVPLSAIEAKNGDPISKAAPVTRLTTSCDHIQQSSLYVCNSSGASGVSDVINGSDTLPTHLFRLHLLSPSDTYVGRRCFHCNQVHSANDMQAWEGLPFCGSSCAKAHFRNRSVDFIVSHKLSTVRPASERAIISGECYNCCRPMSADMPCHLMPVRVDEDKFQYGHWPHCRPECVLRTAYDTPCNFTEWVRLVWLKYGGDLLPAPPRLILFIVGGLTLEQYHRVTDLRLVLHHETAANTWSFPAPAFYAESMTGPFVSLHNTSLADVNESRRVVRRFSCLPLGTGRTLAPAHIAQMNQVQERTSDEFGKDIRPHISPEYVQLEPLSLFNQPIAEHGLPMHDVLMTDPKSLFQ